MSIFDWFKKKSEAPIVKDADPKPGEVWLFSRGGPFSETHAIYVIDVREGWVQYTYSRPDSIRWSEKVEIFKSVFTREAL